LTRGGRAPLVHGCLAGAHAPCPARLGARMDPGPDGRKSMRLGRIQPGSRTRVVARASEVPWIRGRDGFQTGTWREPFEDLESGA